MGAKAFYVRSGYFRDVDVVLGVHVGDKFATSYGIGEGMTTGLVSVEYFFHGKAAHAALAPWEGRSALDAAELMDIGWKFRREHLRLAQRSHRVITNGGDQPNVVPPEAGVWYFFRELDYPHIEELYELGNTMANAAAKMTDTTVDHRLVGSAWPQHYNKIIAEVQQKNIEDIGMPQWSDDDQTLAKALQKEIGAKVEGLKDRQPHGRRCPNGGQRGDGWDVRRRRRYFLECSNGIHALPGEYSQSSRAQLAKRGGHGYSDSP